MENPMQTYCRLVGKCESRMRVSGKTIDVRDKEGGVKKYKLDGVLPTGTSQFDVYKEVGIPVVTQVIRGNDATVISCGGVETGKTTTLFGSSELPLTGDNRGLFVRVIDSSLSRLGNSVQAYISMVAITQENILHDLLKDFTINSNESFQLSQMEQLERSEDPYTLWSKILKGCTALKTRSKNVIYSAVRNSLQQKVKGDFIVIVRLQPEQESIRSSNIMFVDCSPVFSRSVHNLRDVSSLLALHNRSHWRIPYGKFILTSLLKSDFSHHSMSATKIVAHCRMSDVDLNIFDSSSVLSFASMAMLIPRKPKLKTNTKHSERSEKKSAAPSTLLITESLDNKSTSPPSIKTLSSPAAADGAPTLLSPNSHGLFTSYLQCLTKQLRSKEDELKSQQFSLESATVELQKQKTTSELQDVRIRELEKELEAASNNVDNNNNNDDIEQVVSDGELIVVQAARTDDLSIDEWQPENSDELLSDISPDSSISKSELIQCLRCSRNESRDLARRLESSEKQKQSLIVKHITSLSCLEENKRWMRRLKKSIISEKEKRLPAINNDFQARKNGAALAVKEKECKKFKESMESLQAMVTRLSSEYNEKRSSDLLAIRQKLLQSSGTNLQVDELVCENAALRDNISSIMKIMEHCYTENKELSQQLSGLRCKLVAADETTAGLEQRILQNYSQPVSGVPIVSVSTSIPSLDINNGRAGWPTAVPPPQLEQTPRRTNGNKTQFEMR